MQSISCGEIPASRQAATAASSASWYSLRPELREKSVQPIPTIAALFESALAFTGRVMLSAARLRCKAGAPTP
jgi:hypothetical protein